MNCSGASTRGLVKKIISAWSVHGRLEYQGLVKPGRTESNLSCIFQKERAGPKTEGFCNCSVASTLWLCEKIRLCLVCHRATRISRFGESWPMDSAPVRVFMEKGTFSHHRFRQCLGTRKFRLQLDLRSKNQFCFLLFAYSCVCPNHCSAQFFCLSFIIKGYGLDRCAYPDRRILIDGVHVQEKMNTIENKYR